MTKQEVRRFAAQQRAALDLSAVGAGMAKVLFALPAWQSADTVLCFAALPDEPDTDAILRRALAEGKRLLLPRVLSKTEMDWVEITALTQLVPGHFGIAEPPTDPAALPGRLLALVPCMAAGQDGTRLGRGGGYYDRFLAHYTGEKLLLCPAALVLPALPRERWDIPFLPQEILTEKGLLP
mgnify:FL=1